MTGTHLLDLCVFYICEHSEEFLAIIPHEFFEIFHENVVFYTLYVRTYFYSNLKIEVFNQNNLNPLFLKNLFSGSVYGFSDCITMSLNVHVYFKKSHF